MYVLIVAIFFIMLFLGMPVSILLGMVGTGILFYLGGTEVMVQQIGLVSYKSMNEFILVAIPLFILAGQIMLTGGIGEKLFNVADKWLRHLPGGIGVATIASCAFFGAISGSSTATAVTIGAVSMPEMEKRKYPKRFSMAILAAGGTLGILIPPSLPMIMYSAITEQPLEQVFMAGVIPGILLSLLFIIYIALYSRKNIPILEKATWKERFTALIKSFWGLMLPLIILGGIYTGIFTPTEAAGVSVIYALVVCIFIYRSINLKNIMRILKEAGVTSGMLLFIIMGALLFGYALTNLRLPQALQDMILGLGTSTIVIMLIINVIWLILGFFLEVNSIILITLPVLFPITYALGIDPIWLAIIMVINMEMALITPPVGMNLFAIQGIDRKNKLNVFQLGSAVTPFIIIMFITMVIIAIFPEIATWLAYQV